MATIDVNDIEGTVNTIVTGAAEVPFWMAVPAALPLLATLWARYGGQYANMGVGRAVAVFTIVGGASGVLANYIAGIRLEQAGPGVNVLDLMPAVIGSLAGTSAAVWFLLPPSELGQAWADFIEAAGL